jgi:integrase/recombinase XerD
MKQQTGIKQSGTDVKEITPTADHSIISPFSRFAAPRPSTTILTMEQAIEEFIKKFHQSENTRSAYRSDLNQFFKGAAVENFSDLANMQFYDVVMAINSYLEKSKRISRQEENRVLNPATVNRKAYCLSSFFQHLVNVYHYPKNPVAGFQSLKTRKKSNTQSLSRGEMVDLLHFAKTCHRMSKKAYRDYLILIFLFNLALRRAEVSKLKWEDIDHGKHSIDVYQKGGTVKSLPIPNALCDMLKEYREIYRDSCPYIITPTQNNATKVLNKPLSPKQIFRVVIQIVDRAVDNQVIPYKSITPHSLRKTFIELSLNDGEDFISILNATGHSHTDMIRYYDGRDTLKNNAVNGLGRML